MTIHIDLVDGAGGSKTADGWELIRTAKITGVAGYGYAKVKSAVDSLIAYIGDIGAAHPDFAECAIVSFSPDVETNGVVKVRVTYKESHEDDPDFADISFLKPSYW